MTADGAAGAQLDEPEREPSSVVVRDGSIGDYLAVIAATPDGTIGVRYRRSY